MALAAPLSAAAQAMSADSIKVSWTPEQTASSVSVTYYINASSPTYKTVGRTVTHPDRQVVISGLHPFAEYYITVQAGNPGGLSKSTGRSVTTLTAGVYNHKLFLPFSTDESKILALIMIPVTVYLLGMQCIRNVMNYSRLLVLLSSGVIFEDV